MFSILYNYEKIHQVQHLKFKADKLFLAVDGKEYIFRLIEISHKLASASGYEREKFMISPSGYGIHWPLPDEDLAIDGLLGIKHSPSKTKKETASA